MPAYSYLTDTDRAIDRDANEMLSPRANNSGAGYIAQGYANMDVLPEQMLLQDMQERRARLSMINRQDRVGQREEDQSLADQSGFEGYSKFVRDGAGLPEDQRAARIRDRFNTNPDDALNPLIGKATIAMLAGDRAALDAKENVLKAKQVEQDSRTLDFDAAHFDKKAEIAEMELTNSREKANVTRQQLAETKHGINEKNLGAVGQGIFAMWDADTDEDRQSRDDLIKITAELADSDDPNKQESLHAIMDITGGMALGRRVKELKAYDYQRNQQMIANIERQTGVRMNDLPKDRVKRDAAVLAAGNYIDTAKDPVLLDQFKDLAGKLKSYNDSEDSLNLMSSDFKASIAKMAALQKDDSPAARKELRGELALLKAKGAVQGGHFIRDLEAQESDIKRRERDSEINKRNADTIAKAKTGTLAERRLAQAQYVQDYTEKRNAQKDAFDFMKEANDVKDKGMEASFGLDSDATSDQIMQAMKKALPAVSPGLSGKGI